MREELELQYLLEYDDDDDDAGLKAADDDDEICKKCREVLL